MHGEHALFGQNIVHDGEDGLFDLAGVLRAADDGQMLFVIQQDCSLGMGAVPLRDALESGSDDDRVVRSEGLQLLGVGPAQKVADEHALGGQLVDDAERFGIFGVGSGKTVKQEDLPLLQIGDDLFVQCVKPFLRDGAVHFAPGDLIVHSGGVYDELVVRAAAGVFAGFDHQRAGIAEGSFPAAQSVLCQLCRGEIPIDSRGIDDPKCFDPISFHILNDLLFLECLQFDRTQNYNILPL